MQLLRHATRPHYRQANLIGSLSKKTYSSNALAEAESLRAQAQSSDFIETEPLKLDTKFSRKSRKTLEPYGSGELSFSAKLRAHTAAVRSTTTPTSVRQEKKLQKLKKQVEKLERKKRAAAIPEAVVASQGAIMRDQSNQEAILKTLADAIKADTKSTTTAKEKKKKTTKRSASKTSKVDTSALFKHLLAGPSSSDLSALSENQNVNADGWDREGWYDVTWPKDELSSFKTEMDENSAISRGEGDRESPHQKQKRLILYTRRIEGLLQPNGESVLQGQ